MSNFIVSNIPWVWLGVCVLLLIVEALTAGLTTIWGAASAFVMIFISTLGLSFQWQIVIFLVMTIVLVVTTRPILLRKLEKKKTDVASLIGKEVRVTKKITASEKGEAVTANDVIWTACSADGTEIPEKTVCIIEAVEGNTLKLRVKE
ncbi:MAG: NfeD family protein [Sphaerochaetaceae bacterium]|nr:NfeD family protein [Sphaerochaetaceae bacterium]